MSLRKAKQLLELKKQKQNEELTVSQENEEKQQVKPAKQNAFSAFSFGQDESQEQQQTQQQKKQKQQQNKGETEKKKKKKKKKGKGLTAQQLQLKELQQTMKQINSQHHVQSEQTNLQVHSSLLSLNQSKFNYERELRRHFRGWEAERQQEVGEQGQALNKREKNLQKMMKKGMKKSLLAGGMAEFVPIRQKFDLFDEQNHMIRFLMSSRYESWQKQYEAVRNSNDINALFHFMQTHPEHVDSLYSVGQFLRLQGNYRDADALIQRVMYVYEVSMGWRFTQLMKDGGRQIVYDAVSTSLFMAVFKFMDILGKKGCFRSALEYNKFLLKINRADPTACLLCLDFNAISSSQFDFLISFVEDYGKSYWHKDSNVYLMPNFAYSYALGKFWKELHRQEKGESVVIEQEDILKSLLQFTDDDWEQALILPSKHEAYINQNPRILLLRALCLYPRLTLDISTKNDYSKHLLSHSSFSGRQSDTFKQILAHDFWTMVPSSYSYHFLQLDSVDDSDGLDKVMEVYVERSKILWKGKQVMLWMKGAMGYLLNRIQAGKFNYQEHLEKLCLEDYPALILPFPLRRYSRINKSNFSDRVDRIDLNNIRDNQQPLPQNQANRVNLQANPLQLFLNSLLPWVNLPEGEQGDPDMPFIEQDQQ